MAEVPDDVARELYAAPPDGFTAAREAFAASAVSAGDPQTAKAIKALRKPTVAAWTVNLLAIRRPQLIQELAALASSLRQAQRELRGDQLRSLAGERRKVVAALVAEAQKLATAAQPGVRIPVAEIESTLTAAMADEEIAAQVRSGRLVRTAAASGDFTVDPSFTPTKVDKPVSAAVRKELAAAQKAEEKARADLEAAETASREAAAELERIEEELDALRERRNEAEQELTRRKQQHRFAQRALAAASRHLLELSPDS